MHDDGAQLAGDLDGGGDDRASWGLTPRSRLAVEIRQPHHRQRRTSNVIGQRLTGVAADNAVARDDVDALTIGAVSAAQVGRDVVAGLSSSTATPISVATPMARRWGARGAIDAERIMELNMTLCTTITTTTSTTKLMPIRQ